MPGAVKSKNFKEQTKENSERKGGGKILRERNRTLDQVIEWQGDEETREGEASGEKNHQDEKILSGRSVPGFLGYHQQIPGQSLIPNKVPGSSQNSRP